MTGLIFQNGPLPLKYRVRPSCKKIKLSSPREELCGGSTGSRPEVESDSGSDKPCSPAARDLTTTTTTTTTTNSSLLAKPSTALQSGQSGPSYTSTFNGLSSSASTPTTTTDSPVPAPKSLPLNSKACKPTAVNGSPPLGWLDQRLTPVLSLSMPTELIFLFVCLFRG